MNRRRLVGGAVVVGVAVAVLVAVLQLGSAAVWPERASIAAPAAPPPPRAGYSNIDARDYVGPEVCGDCHGENHAHWQRSLHASMNRLAGRPGAVVGDFSGVALRYGGGVATFTRDAGGTVMVLAKAGVVRRFRVTRTIGSRYLQEYVGVEEGAPDADEIRLPFGWWRRPGRWLPRPYFDSWYPAEYAGDGSIATDPFVPDAEPWADRCAWCHNTYPFELRALRSTERGIGQGLEQYYDLVVERLPAAARAAVVEQNRLPTAELVTVGISCESCHLGGRAHATNDQPIRFVPTSGDLRRRAGAPDLSGGRHNPRVVDRICAQCHSTPAPRYPNGAAARNSSEALDLLAGACVPKIACTDCHDPHVAGAGEGAPDPPRAVRACTRCHEELASPGAARAHSRHGPGVTCLDCHMPKIVIGVSEMVRSHRISSPADPAMLAAAAPNACNLCHLDRSIAWTVRALARGWGARLAPDDRWRLAYGGSLDAPLGPAWLASASHTARVTAAAAYARSPQRRAALPRLLARLDDPVAYYRMFMLFAIDDALGRALEPDEYDPMAAPAARAAQLRRLLARARAGTL